MADPGSLGFRVEDLVCEEQDAALGNGGLGRLAACFMDSLASLEYPAWGYGIRYTYGIFQQRIQDGFQTEVPDYWLSLGNPWEIERIDVAYDVGFRGSVRSARVNGSLVHVWEPAERVVAIAYDYPIPGFRTTNTNNIRLWSAKPKKEFDFAEFNEGRYESSVQEQHEAGLRFLTQKISPPVSIQTTRTRAARLCVSSSNTSLYAQPCKTLFAVSKRAMTNGQSFLTRSLYS